MLTAEKAGDIRMETKNCTGCKEDLPLSNFYADKRYNSSTNFRSQCKPCINEANRNHYKDDPNRIRDTFYRRKYGISHAEYNIMLEEQNYVCALCREPETGGKTKFLSVDHDHDTGRVRSLLCGKCNRLLGQYEKNKELFSKFEQYIATHKGY